MTTRRLAARLLAAALLAAPSALAEAPADPVVAQRGGVTLTAGAVREMVQYADPETRQKLQRDPAALAQLVRARLVQAALLEEARAKRWDQTPEIAWRAERAREAVIADTYLGSVSQPDPAFPSEAELQAAYDANKARLMVPRQYHVAQIFIAVPENAAPQAEEEARRKLADLRAALAKRGDFAELARRQSEDRASAAQGGDLGWLREDRLIAPVRAAVAGLQEGAVSDPVRAADGWHVLRLLGTRPAAPAPLAEVRESLVAALRQERQAQNARAYIAALLAREPAQINEIELARLGGR